MTPQKGNTTLHPAFLLALTHFKEYYQVWDTNPVTGESWTYDSLNSLAAGFKYDGGQSE